MNDKIKPKCYKEVIKHRYNKIKWTTRSRSDNLCVFCGYVVILLRYGFETVRCELEAPIALFEAPIALFLAVSLPRCQLMYRYRLFE